MAEQNDPRILFAAERTLLAWNRTSIALIAFGFLVERSGLLIKVLVGPKSDSISMTITIFVGLLFMFVGSFVAAYSSKQYSAVLKTLNPSDVPVGYFANWGVAVNILVAVLGVVLSVAIILAH